MIDLFRERAVGSYLEIGSRHGDTFYEVMLSLPRYSVGVAVDLPGGPWGLPSSRKALDGALVDLHFRGYRARAVYGDSTSKDVKDAVLETAVVCGIEKFDAILIDGDHRYDGVLADWLAWRDLGRLIAFHDIAGDGVTQRASGDPVEVPRLWRELKANHQTMEFVAPGSKMGIGIVLP